MKIKVINLRSRLDRLELFTLNNSKYLPDFEVLEAFNGRDYTHEQLVAMGYDTDKNWRDPILDRVLTKGEIGCFISHYKMGVCMHMACVSVCKRSTAPETR